MFARKECYDIMLKIAGPVAEKFKIAQHKYHYEATTNNKYVSIWDASDLAYIKLVVGKDRIVFEIIESEEYSFEHGMYTETNLSMCAWVFNEETQDYELKDNIDVCLNTKKYFKKEVATKYGKLFVKMVESLNKK